MKFIRQSVLSVLTISLSLPLLVVVPAFASHNDEAGVSTETEVTNDGSQMAETKTSGSSAGVKTESHNQSGSNRQGKTMAKTSAKAHDDTTELESKTEHDQRVTDLRARGKVIHDQLAKETGHVRSADERQQACTKRKANLENRLVNMNQRVTFLQSKIDDIYTKALAYQTAKNVSNDSLTTLITTADQAKAETANAIVAMQSLQPAIDCTKSDNATNIANFKAASEATRDALKTYKSAVKALLVALHAVAEPTTNTGTGA